MGTNSSEFLFCFIHMYVASASYTTLYCCNRMPGVKERGREARWCTPVVLATAAWMSETGG